jgi:hypothetical protein
MLLIKVHSRYSKYKIIEAEPFLTLPCHYDAPFKEKAEVPNCDARRP